MPRLLAAVLAVALASVARGASVELNVISAVEAKQEGADVVVSIRGSKPPNFTTFSMADPPRFVIDLSESRFEGVKEDVTVPGGLIDVIKNLSYGSDATSIARVMIAFSVEVDPPEVQTIGETLIVRVVRPGGTAVAQASPATEEARAKAELAALQAEAERKSREDAEMRAELERQAAASRAAPQQAARGAAQPAQGAAGAAATGAAAAATAAGATGVAAAADAARRQEEAEAQARAGREAQARADQEAQAQREAQAQAEREAQARAEHEAQARAATEAAAVAEAARRAQEAAEAQARTEREAQARAEQEAQAQAQRDAQARADEEAQAEAARRAQDAAAQARAEEERLSRAAAAFAGGQAAARGGEAQPSADERAGTSVESPGAGARDTRVAAAESVSSQGERLEAGSPAAQLREVGFRQMPGISRVYLRTTVTPRFSIQDLGEDTIRVELENTRALRRNDTRFLDTSFFPSAVALITPSKRGSSYVLDIKLRQRVPYQQRIEGDMLAIDFERPAAGGAPAPGAEPAAATHPAAGDAGAEESN